MLVILPITQGFVIILNLVMLLTGAVSLYADGTFSFPNNSAIADVSLSNGQVALAFFFIGSGIWTLFFLHGCNNFILSSATAVWYFFNSNGNAGSPCCDSLWRLLRYHLGSVALASILNGLLFIVKIIANVLSFDSHEDDSSVVTCFLKCLNCIFCAFRMYFACYFLDFWGFWTMEPILKSLSTVKITSQVLSKLTIYYTITNKIWQSQTL